ncbi:PQQ-binding-like beta-propeller repeat protein [Thioclava sp. IC9]|uniref:pyrroloquinoline quinone-dependent dehydrogenase n=1 Tax=Thioclava sp. IC9 TaxID=1973007 RepID=UPI000B546DAA|nr:PQQ-binding-like beta-propeller repeat protein [Thioclava sp. IC9]OWY04432.1 pyrrolo-quinoline quinone [Thioclava sp. IC9]
MAHLPPFTATSRGAVRPLILSVCVAALPALAHAKQSDEIQGTSDTNRAQMKELPASANVAVDDNAMRSAKGNKSDWLLHGRSYSNQRYSPLDQITTDNIDKLHPVALVQTGKVASFETTPIVVDGVMYISTPMVDNEMTVMALDAATGETYWSTTYDVSQVKTCCGPVNRGVAVGYGKVYIATLDANLLALDAKTGKKVWKTNLADPQAGFSETMAPQIYDGKVIVGSSGGEWPIRGFVAAIDAKSGEEVWRWHATDPDTFEGDSWKSGGGMVWTTPAIDPERNMVIFSTGNPNPDLDGSSRKGDNLYTDSIVALDADTGKRKWYYQEVKHDVWDYDAVSNVVLFDAKDSNGKVVPAAGEAGKVGWLYVVNRETGDLIRKSDPLVKMSDNMFTPPTKDGVKILPGANGGAEWSPPAYSPETNLFYVMEMNQLMNFTTDGETTTLPGTLRLGSTFKNVKGDEAMQTGVLDAVNVNTGKVEWSYDAPQPMIGGVLATAGNLVFTGEGNGMFDAFNAKSGEKLWSFNLGAGVNAPPITYQVDGEQYVAVAAGGNFQLGFPRGDVVAIFKLD